VRLDAVKKDAWIRAANPKRPPSRLSCVGGKEGQFPTAAQGSITLLEQRRKGVLGVRPKGGLSCGKEIEKRKKAIGKKFLFVREEKLLIGKGEKR